VNGKAQQPWLGGGFSRYLVDLGGWPGWHISGDWPSAGFQAFYPAAKTRVSAELFRKQAATAVQLVNVLMTKDVIALAPVWGQFDPNSRSEELPADAFREPGDAAGAKRISADRRGILSSVRDGQYDQALAGLRTMSMDADYFLVPATAEKIKSSVAEATIWAERGIVWQQQGLRAPAYAQTPPGY
jgi:hypothetical protein